MFISEWERPTRPPSIQMGVTAGIFLASVLLKEMRYLVYTAISIKVVHEQSGKFEYERERLLGIPNKLMNFHSNSQQPFALVFNLSALLVDNLN